MTIKNTFEIFPVGIIHNKDQSTSIEIYQEFEEALTGLEDFSHIIVSAWFHQHDKDDLRKTLKVFPRKDKSNPLTGVFATRSPVRPNLMAIFYCRIISIKGNIIQIDFINAFNDTPVIDIKPYIPNGDSIPNAKVPEWVKVISKPE